MVNRKAELVEYIVQDSSGQTAKLVEPMSKILELTNPNLAGGDFLTDLLGVCTTMYRESLHLLSEEELEQYVGFLKTGIIQKVRVANDNATERFKQFLMAKVIN